MTHAETLAAKATLKKLAELDVPALFRQSNPNGPLDEICIGEMSASEFCAAYKRVVSNFQTAIEEEGLLFPLHMPNGHHGNIALTEHLSSLHSYVAAKNWNPAKDILLRLVSSMMSMGLWNKVTKRAHLEYQNQAQKLLSDAELKVAELNSSLTKLREEEATLRKQISESRTEMEEISDELNTSKAAKEKIEEILGYAQRDHGIISQLLKAWREHFDEAKSTKSTDETRQEELTKLLKDADAYYQRAKGDSTWIDGKRGEINDLVGKAADGSLGGSFLKRSQTLQTSVDNWKWTLLGFGIVIFIYIICVYTLIPVPTDPTLALVTGFGKLSPAVVLLLFVIRQYSRERSFLEEYAFKASVALVVNAYADQIAGVKFDKDKDAFDDETEWKKYLIEKDKERRKLISDTVSKLFTPPHIHTERGPNLFSVFRPKTLLDVVRETKDLIKTAKAD